MILNLYNVGWIKERINKYRDVFILNALYIQTIKKDVLIDARNIIEQRAIFRYDIVDLQRENIKR